VNTRNVSKTVKIALLVILAFAVIQILFTGSRIRRRLADSSPPSTSPDASPNWSNEIGKPGNTRAILQADLFGLGDDATVVSQLSTNQGQMDSWSESAGLHLVGTITGPPTVARAIIQNSGSKNTTHHRIGDKIGGASIVAIRKNEVVLLDAGVRKILQRSSGGAVSSDLTLPPTTSIASSEHMVTPVPLPPPPPEHRTVVTDLMTKATIKPHQVEGTVEGLEITGLDEVPLAKKLGLRDGDIIRVLNGQRVTNRQKAFQVLRKAKSQNSLTIELSRNGRDKTLTFP
jgi:type II secretion system protein C